MTVYAYLRVSTEDQTVESQKLGIVEYATRQGLTIDKYITDDGVSGTVLAKDRNLNKILKQAKEGDKVIVSELSRLGRSTADVINTCQIFIKKGVSCYFIKQNMALDNTPMGKMMVAILSAFAEMERDLISQRTIEGLRRAKAQGKVLGRPIGCRNLKLKTDAIAEEIISMFNQGKTKTEIAKKFNLSKPTLYRFLIKKGVIEKQDIERQTYIIDGMPLKKWCELNGVNYKSVCQWRNLKYSSFEEYARYLKNKKEQIVEKEKEKIAREKKLNPKIKEIFEEIKREKTKKTQIIRTKNSIKLVYGG